MSKVMQCSPTGRGALAYLLKRQSEKEKKKLTSARHQVKIIMIKSSLSTKCFIKEKESSSRERPARESVQLLTMGMSWHDPEFGPPTPAY